MSAPKLKILTIDTETTGMGPDADVIEFAMAEVHGNGTEWLHYTPASFLFGTDQTMEPGAMAAHHIMPGDIRDLPSFADRAPILIRHNYGTGAELAAIAAHNAEFDAPRVQHLFPGVPWICTYKCALRAWPAAPSHNNQVLRYWLMQRGDWPTRFFRVNAEPAHRAGPDAYTTAALLTVLLRLHPIETLLQWSAEPRQVVKMPMGQHRGEFFTEIPTSYLSWILTSNMGEDIKDAARREMDARADQRSARK